METDKAKGKKKKIHHQTKSNMWRKLTARSNKATEKRERKTQQQVKSNVLKVKSLLEFEEAGGAGYAAAAAEEMA